MPGYIAAILLRFQYSIPNRPQHSPHSCSRIIYGKNPQSPIKNDTSPNLPPAGVLHVQQVVGCILYYTLAVDITFLAALSDLGSKQSRTTTETQGALVWLLNYAATHPDTVFMYVASDMCIHVHSTASYLSVPPARSRAGGHFFLCEQAHSRGFPIYYNNQWRNSCGLPDHKKCHGFRGRGRNRCRVH